MTPYTRYLHALIARDPSVQADVGATPDGRWGPLTQRAVLVALDAEWHGVCDRNRWRIDACGGYRVRTQPIDRVILHWPGSTRTAASLADSWRRNVGASNVSSHCGIDENEVVWYRPPHTVTHHAGTANGGSLGIDICAPILGEHEGNARRRGLFVGRSEMRFSAPNGGHHGGDWLHLHPALAMRVAAVRRALDHMGLTAQWVDHNHVDPNRKPDCTGWHDTLRRVGALDI